MMPRTRITRVDFSFTVHSTESFEKNMLAFANIITGDILKRNKLLVEEIEGGYGNLSKFVELTLLKSKDIDLIIQQLSTRLTKNSKILLAKELEQRWDKEKNRFYIRLDKEEAYRNNLIVNHSPRNIRIELRFNSYGKDINSSQLLSELGLIDVNSNTSDN